MKDSVKELLLDSAVIVAWMIFLALFIFGLLEFIDNAKFYEYEKRGLKQCESKEGFLVRAKSEDYVCITNKVLIPMEEKGDAK